MAKGQIKQAQINTTYIVYMHIAPSNKKYIGITKEKNPKERWRKGKGYWTNEHFTSAINKYGWDNIQHIILYKELTKERAEQKEIELIAKYKTNNRQYGYNIEKGGSLNKEVSQETREKLRKNMLGKKHSKETKQKMSEVRKGENCYWYGKHLSNETKQKLSDKKKKKVNQYTIDGKFIKTFNSMDEASKEYDVTRQNIYANCSGKRKTACGFIWRYADEESR